MKQLLLVLAIAFVAGCSATSSSTKQLDGPAETMTLYKSNCVACHGSSLQGQMGPTTNLTKVGQRLTVDQISNQIKNGGQGMPAFKDRLTDANVQELATWLATKK